MKLDENITACYHDVEFYLDGQGPLVAQSL